MTITYEYDHGDSWKHTISLTGYTSKGTNVQFGVPEGVEAFCIAGEGDPCAEDCGGIDGWEALKDAFKHPGKADPDDQKSWYKAECLNGEKKGLDPYKFSVLDVNDAIQEADLLEG